MEEKCSLPTEIYSRVVGYFRPVQNWNEGKKAEFADRKSFMPSISALEEEKVEVPAARG